MANRRSAPKTGSGKRKDALVQLRLDAAEKAAFQDAADLAGLGLSAWIRQRLRWAATRELQEANRPAAFLGAERE